ncbi:HIT-like protein [Periconia macrospinosa]|uniref:HIT-like protein n=1 Tax=Periconia macrospinosa TaxID=97972 RepID=A0A2V1ED87_9PLEO|nr:HIT-like protein [Periconia macrospinosa]
MVSELDLQYPPEQCPFCNIARAYQEPGSKPKNAKAKSALWNPPSQRRLSGEVDGKEEVSLESCVPQDHGENGVDPERTSPASFVVLASKDGVAFLDILPMVGGHLLVATRQHRVKVADMKSEEAREMGFWLPILSRVVARVTGVDDYNIVQNNGARAAQVVPHVHFHIIPRPGTMPEIKSKSWAMFGRGQREELDDEHGAKLAAEMRRVLREEIEKMQRKPKL